MSMLKARRKQSEDKLIFPTKTEGRTDTSCQS
jgi:hypothetical protein